MEDHVSQMARRTKPDKKNKKKRQSRGDRIIQLLPMLLKLQKNVTVRKIHFLTVFSVHNIRYSSSKMITKLYIYTFYIDILFPFKYI
uniref:Uncharacterized protein n=1 Tax=Anguilla anguilla TaxID=7936 RepID=A0A0E9RXA9_ANGAN